MLMAEHEHFCHKWFIVSMEGHGQPYLLLWPCTGNLFAMKI